MGVIFVIIKILRINKVEGKLDHTVRGGSLIRSRSIVIMGKNNVNIFLYLLT